MTRIYSPEEIQNFTDAERELAALGLLVDDKFNQDVVIGWFDQHPEVAATKQAIMNFAQHPQVKPKLNWKSQAQMEFESAASKMTPTELDVLESFMKSNRLFHGPDDDRTFSNAYSLIMNNHGRPWNPHVLGTWTLPQAFGSLKWVERAADPNKRYGQHSGKDALRHFAPKTESNTSFSHRVMNNSTTIPRPVSSSKLDEHQWTQMANALRADSGRHSDNASIQGAIKAVLNEGGSPEEAYREGVRVKNQLRMDRERGR